MYITHYVKNGDTNNHNRQSYIPSDDDATFHLRSITIWIAAKTLDLVEKAMSQVQNGLKLQKRNVHLEMKTVCLQFERNSLPVKIG